jgi:hypothetical protein
MSAVEGAPTGRLVPFGFTPATLPREACTPGSSNTTCRAPYLQCSTTSQACTCANGIDTCYGYCIDTPCGACNKCVANVRPFTDVNKNNPSNTSVANAWTTFCTDTLKRGSNACEFVRMQIVGSINGNIGKRAGMICQLLQDCALIPGDCRLVPAQFGAAASPLDLCTVGGTTAGVQVPGVQSTAAFLPTAGSCLDGSHCTSKPGQVCNKQITTDMPTCNGGVDGFVTVGVCERTHCQNCKVRGGPKRYFGNLLGNNVTSGPSGCAPFGLQLHLASPKSSQRNNLASMSLLHAFSKAKERPLPV